MVTMPSVMTAAMRLWDWKESLIRELELVTRKRPQCVPQEAIKSPVACREHVHEHPECEKWDLAESGRQDPSEAKQDPNCQRENDGQKRRPTRSGALQPSASRCSTREEGVSRVKSSTYPSSV